VVRPQLNAIGEFDHQNFPNLFPFLTGNLVDEYIFWIVIKTTRGKKKNRLTK
jgi:hypothetical protein